VAWADGVSLPNNNECVNLLEGKPLGLLRLLDSTCSLGSAAKDGKALVAAFTQSHGTSAGGGVVVGSRGRTASVEKVVSGGGTTKGRGASSPGLPAAGGNGDNSYCPCGFATAWRKRNGDRTTDEDFAVCVKICVFIYLYACDNR
jgi:hypothetical protein